ncbi:hypothetical protein JCM11491_000567 [Sporobolomyces phaffii]
MSYTEQSLKALTVVKLKEILAQHSLAVTGKKDDLVARILESDLSSSSDPVPDATATATDEPDGAGVGAAQELGPAVASASTETDETTIDPPVDANPAAADAVPASSTETTTTAAGPNPEEQRLAREAALEQEEEKRKARLARFGGGGGGTATSDAAATDDAKKKRAERFGITLNDSSASSERQSKLDHSLDLLDKPLGSNRRERERKPKAADTTKPAAPTSRSNPVNGETVAHKTGNPAAGGGPPPPPGYPPLELHNYPSSSRIENPPPPAVVPSDADNLAAWTCAGRDHVKETLEGLVKVRSKAVESEQGEVVLAGRIEGVGNGLVALARVLRLGGDTRKHRHLDLKILPFQSSKVSSVLAAGVVKNDTSAILQPPDVVSIVTDRLKRNSSNSSIRPRSILTSSLRDPVIRSPKP